MKTYEIRAMGLEEVRRELMDAEDNLANLKIQLKMNQLDDALRVRHARRDVARFRTILREQEMGIHRLAAAPTGEEQGASAGAVETSGT